MELILAQIIQQLAVQMVEITPVLVKSQPSSLTTGSSNNTTLGMGALKKIVDGNNNSAVGYASLFDDVDGIATDDALMSYGYDLWRQYK